MAILDAVFADRPGQTPQEVERRRRIAKELLAQAGGAEPIRSPWQGVAKIAQALVGGYEEAAADKQDASNRTTANKALIDAVYGGSSDSAPSFNSQVAATSPSASVSGPPSTTTGGKIDPSIRSGIVQTAKSLGVDPIDLATAISYETGGTFDPTKSGPTTKYGTHRGFIQFGEPQARQHGVNWDDPINSQLGENGAVASYLRAAGVKPGMGLLDIYSAINAGGVGRYGASDAAAGGAPGTVADKVNSQMAGHRAKALAFIGEPQQVASLDPSVGMPPRTASEAVTAMGAGGSGVGGGATAAASPFAPASLSDEVAAYQQTPEYAARFPGRQQLRPFRPGETRPNADGSYSTEITTTWQLPSGEWVNVPSLWMGPNGPQQFNPEDEQGILGAMQSFEAQNGPTFQRYRSAQEAEQAAKQRSSAGGAGAGPQTVSSLPVPPNAQPLPQGIPAEFAGSQQLANAQGGIVPALMGGTAASPEQIAQARALGAAQPQPQPQGQDNRALIATLLGNPYTAEAGQQLLMQEMQRRQEANDPMKAMQVEEQRLKLNALKNPPPDFDYINGKDGSVFRADKRTGEIKQVYGGKPDTFRTLTDAEEQQMGLDTSKAYQIGADNKVSQIGGGGTTVNIDQKAEGAFDKKLAEKQAETFDAMATEGLNARADIGIINELDTLLQGQGGTLSGIAGIAAKYGVGGEGIGDLQAVQALINKLVPSQRAPGSGSMSDRDVELFTRSLPSLWNEPGGNAKILRVMRGLAEYKQAQGEIADQVLTGDMSRQEARRALRSLPNPLAQAEPKDEAGSPPAGVDAEDWKYMTPEERKLFQ